jgi:hypothetical protein
MGMVFFFVAPIDCIVASSDYDDGSCAQFFSYYLMVGLFMAMASLYSYVGTTGQRIRQQKSIRDREYKT